jgi:hypothetical protein
MTTVETSQSPVAVPTGPPPWSRALRITAGVCLVAGGLLNGLPQVVAGLLTGADLSFGEQIVWGADHTTAHALEQTALVVSSLVMPIGLLGIAHVARFRAPVLTAIAVPLVVWGMWGFGNVLAMGYVSGTVAPSVLGVDAAVELNDGLSEHVGTVSTALVPHLIGSFLGLILLSAAAWRAGTFPRTPLVLLVAFLVWDFGLPPLGPVDPHVLLVVAWTWLGVHLVRMPGAVWRGAAASTREA